MRGILILDYGSQYTQLIARAIREEGVYSEIYSCYEDFEKIKSFNPYGIILSGGPSSVYEKDAPDLDERIFSLNVPVLGICYGLQILTKKLGGEVERGKEKEYGRAIIDVIKRDGIFRGVKKKIQVWMSHGDRVKVLPPGFVQIACSSNSPYAGIADEKRKIFGVQFHPEVAHTPDGKKIIRNFLEICSAPKNWNMASFLDYTIKRIREEAGDSKVICAVSGGVDSTVTAVLLHRAIGDRAILVFVNNGLLRKGEVEEVLKNFRKMGLPLLFVNAEKEFLGALKGVKDPEEKRKIIGNKFIEVFERAIRGIKGVKFLAQGTLYPDLIESRSYRGPSAKIKTHHNVGGLPERMRLKLIEPLKELFKDEVRKLGMELGIDREILMRHPFPGPSLAVRIIGEVTKKRLDILREADHIFIEELKKSGLYDKVWQAFSVLLPLKTVGIKGDRRSYEWVIALRAVDSRDGMTADWSKLPHRFLERVATRIVNEVDGVNRVVYDITSKPPATIEWE
jgi:GMP synthase (glutamine-hydrolysing)